MGMVPCVECDRLFELNDVKISIQCEYKPRCMHCFPLDFGESSCTEEAPTPRCGPTGNLEE